MESAASDPKRIGDASADRNEQKQHRASRDDSAHAPSLGLALSSPRGEDDNGAHNRLPDTAR